MTSDVSGPRTGIYLRAGAIDRLTAPIGVIKLTRQQQASLVGLPYTTFWRITARGWRVSDQGIAQLLLAAADIAERWQVPCLGFDDLFEVRAEEARHAALVA